MRATLLPASGATTADFRDSHAAISLFEAIHCDAAAAYTVDPHRICLTASVGAPSNSAARSSLLDSWPARRFVDDTILRAVELPGHVVSSERRALGPTIGGAFAVLGWWILRRRTEVPPLADVITCHRRMRRLPLSIDAALQVLLVGSGASLGREGAPSQFAAALGDLGNVAMVAHAPRPGDPPCVCSRGGLAAVYSVPLGGALFAIQRWHPRVVGTALITSSLAVAVASPVTHEAASLDRTTLRHCVHLHKPTICVLVKSA